MKIMCKDNLRQLIVFMLEMRDQRTIRTKEDYKMSDVIISTGSISEKYEVIDTIFALGSGEAGLLTRAPDNAFKGVKSELASKCKALGGDAVIFCQFEYRITLNEGLFGKKQGVEIFAYGTAVRMQRNL